ncbi:TIM-barrel domain-containing protein [Sphingomonas qilianensis]|uniref:TIM-barrel domain-containing protein n=1 Tax=Sphingomonas qilianensis TaxID=1736690 RepID=A0ABU9XT32_9SPHN
MNKALIGVLLAGSAMSAAHAAAAPYEKIDGGVVVTPTNGTAARVEVTVHGDGMFHVIAIPAAMKGYTAEASLMVPAAPKAGAYEVTERAGHVLIRAARGTADIELATGEVSFLDAAGRVVLDQAGAPRFAPTTIDGRQYVTASQQFNRASDEGFYGLGQHQNQQMNYNGEDVELAQHNMDIAVPFLVSTRNYGILWDNDGITRFGNPAPYKLLGDGLKVTSGGKPGFAASYYLNDKLAVMRQEATINYQYIRDQANWPEAAKAQTTAATGGQNTAGNAVQKQRVVWTGQVTPDKTGVHKFQLYGSSYFKVFMNGREVLNRWRQNWNPWYANFDLPMTRGKKVDVRVEWEPNAGYIALLHNDPLPAADRHSVWFTSDVARSVNYWYVPGRDMDDVVAGYRKLTGKAVMMPKWAYGFWQSRQRYNTQAELVGVVQKYRELNIPIDNIVQDWFYWPENAWGSHDFDKARFPDPKGMVEQVHDLHANIMISVWPKFYPTTENYKEFAAKGLAYQGNLKMGNKDWVGPGYLNTVYDPYSAEGRHIFWQQIENKLGKIGMDAWWADASEPDLHSNLSIEERTAAMGPTARGPAAEYFNSFPLMNSAAFYDGWRAFKPDVRPFLLTRSGFGGLQRNGAAVWSGDVASRWYDLRAQISAGVNTSFSGLPNWTHDIGGFALEDRYAAAKPLPADLDEWRELNLRWFQFGAFSPLFRSHGEPPFREIYEISPAGSPMRASMVWYDELRYRLMPYIYTVAADTWFKDGSIMRGLVMDWPNDAQARTVNDEFLFGKAFLAAPVTEYKARTRKVYLPDADQTWYDYHSGQAYRGGRTITATAPLERMPLFVRAGSIVPMGPVQQYVDQLPDAPITLVVYTGANGQFSLYEDDGRSEQYRSGAFSRVALNYDEASGTLTLGAREGKGYANMPASRTIKVRWIGPNQSADAASATDTTVTYTGAAMTVTRQR